MGYLHQFHALHTSGFLSPAQSISRVKKRVTQSVLINIHSLHLSFSLLNVNVFTLWLYNNMKRPVKFFADLTQLCVSNTTFP